MNWNYVEGSGRGLVLCATPAFACRLRKTTKGQGSRSAGRDLKSGPPEYEARVLTIQPRRSVKSYTTEHRQKYIFLKWCGSSTQAWMPTYVSILRIPQMIWVWRATVKWYWQGKTEELGDKPVPVPPCPPQIPHGLTQARTRASAVGGRRLTTWAMARPLAEVHNAMRLPQVLYPRTLSSSNKDLVGKHERNWSLGRIGVDFRIIKIYPKAIWCGVVGWIILDVDRRFRGSLTALMWRQHVPLKRRPTFN
jgi:hypothetical protein